MRRYVILTVAAGTLMLGCSSTNDSAPASSTTTSSVVISAENAKACADLKTFQQTMLDGVETVKAGSPAEQAAALKGMYTNLIPVLETAKASVPAELVPAVELQIEANKKASEIDATSTEGQQELIALAVFPTGDTKSSSDELVEWGKANCGLAFGK